MDYYTNLLTGTAHYWWDMMSSTLGKELMSMLTWDQFKLNFYEENCYQTIVWKLKQEFSQLTQGSKSVQEYTIEFNDKACFSRQMVDIEERKIDKYRWGLRTQIRELIQESKYTILRQVVDATKDCELEIKRHDHDGERGDSCLHDRIDDCETENK